MSSRRTPGPITTDGYCWASCCRGLLTPSALRSRSVWVPAFAGTTAECLSTPCENFRIRISNSQALSSSRRRASWAFSLSPLDIEGRRNAERRTLVTAAAYFLDRQETEAHGNAFRRPAAAFFKTSVRSSGDLAPGDFAPLACPRPATSVADPCSGAGRKPKASRVCACEAQPQAPHRPSGCPSGQLSLCPASERLMKRPSLDRTRAG
jgi:hypothetical protein